MTMLGVNEHQLQKRHRQLVEHRQGALKGSGIQVMLASKRQSAIR
jgi:hypothetical protein